MVRGAVTVYVWFMVGGAVTVYVWFMVGGAVTVYVWFLGQIFVHKCQTYTVAFAPAVRCTLRLAQCRKA